MINLFTSFYNEPNAVRRNELKACRIKNAINPLIDKMYIFSESNSKKDLYEIIYNASKTIINVIKNKPKYSDFFKLVNKVTGENDINIIANSDIIFDETLSFTNQLKENDCWALSRWEMNQDGSNGELIQRNGGDSQDVWIFKGKIKSIDYCDFELGKMGCDNRIAHEIKQAGYNITNPCLTVKTWHLHHSNIRNYDITVRDENTVVPPPYLLLPLITL